MNNKFRYLINQENIKNEEENNKGKLHPLIFHLMKADMEMAQVTSKTRENFKNSKFTMEYFDKIPKNKTEFK